MRNLSGSAEQTSKVVGVVVQYQNDYLVVADTLLLATPIFNTLSPPERTLLVQTPMPPPMSYRDGEGIKY